MTYKIEISYQTGDSFNSEDTTDILELTWNNEEVAKENLKAIEEHYKNVYQPINKTRWSREKRTPQEILEEFKDEWWFVNDIRNGKLDEYANSYCMNLKADNGNLMRIHCYWCGYFERLYSAEILFDKSDMKFTI